MVQVDYLILADAAAVAEGKHYIHGAGWDALATPSFPVIHPTMSIAIRLRIPWSDTNHMYIVELDIIDADGRSILPESPGPIRTPITVGRPSHIAPGNDQVLPLVFTLHRLQFRQPGTFAVIVRVEDEDLARAPFHVCEIARR